MYWTKAFIPTLREAPADAEILSHKLLLRAGLIRKLAGGVYTFLPLGFCGAGNVLFKLKDSGNREWVLSPTAEEVITTIAAAEINSYRQLPKNFYQISVKFRDEIRPRFGLMRAREFIMKDAYSFDLSDEAAQVCYQKMYDAYARIFARCGLKAFPVDAATRLRGGQA